MNDKKKGLLATIWESMTKTGGCNCGPGDSCYGSTDEDDEKCADKEEAKQSDN